VIRVVVDDLAFVEADAVIRPTTAFLEPTSVSLRRLERIGGPQFWEQLTTHGELAVGSAVVTASGDLTADLVVHAVICSPDQPVTVHNVKRALISALQRAGDWQLALVAVPPMGTGAGNLELEDAAAAMVEVLGLALNTATYPKEVCIVVDDDEQRAVFETYLKRLPQ
jgi:O-acetyl-ADP-ribose deacetylase (regulator of RNase III)